MCPCRLSWCNYCCLLRLMFSLQGKRLLRSCCCRLVIYPKTESFNPLVCRNMLLWSVLLSSYILIVRVSRLLLASMFGLVVNPFPQSQILGLCEEALLIHWHFYLVAYPMSCRNPCIANTSSSVASIQLDQVFMLTQMFKKALKPLLAFSHLLRRYPMK